MEKGQFLGNKNIGQGDTGYQGKDKNDFKVLGDKNFNKFHLDPW